MVNINYINYYISGTHYIARSVGISALQHKQVIFEIVLQNIIIANNKLKRFLQFFKQYLGNVTKK